MVGHGGNFVETNFQFLDALKLAHRWWWLGRI